MTQAEAAGKSPSSASNLLLQIGHLERDISRNLLMTQADTRQVTPLAAKRKAADPKEYRALLHQLELQASRLPNRMEQRQVLLKVREVQKKVLLLKQGIENQAMREKQKTWTKNMRQPGTTPAQKSPKPQATPRTNGAIGGTPPNDICVNATNVIEGSYTGSTTSATNDGGESCVTSASEDVWYSYTATGSGTIQVDTIGSDFDTVLSVHNPPCPGTASNQIVCNDDCVGVDSCVTFSAVAGNTYMIRVGSFYPGVTGPVALNIARVGGISGTILDDVTSAPLAGVYVNIYDSNGYYMASVNTDSSGNYTSDGLHAGNYFVFTYGDSNHMPELYNDISCDLSDCNPVSGTPVSVQSGETAGGINFRLQPGGSITGTVTDASTGGPLSNMEVDVYDETGLWITFAYTDDSGTYTAGGLTTKNYKVRTRNYTDFIDELYDNLACPGYCDVTAGTSIPVTISQTTSNINFSLTPMGKITGVITEGDTGFPISGVTVMVYDHTGSYVSYGITDAAGAYTAGGLPGGTYFVSTYNYADYMDELYDNIPCPGGYCDPLPGTRIAVTDNHTTSGINFALTHGGKINGRVTIGSGAPLSNTWITVYDSTGYPVSGASTNTSGEYSATGLITGNYFVATSNFNGYMDELYNDISCPSGYCDPLKGTPVSVRLDQTTSGIDFVLSDAGSITGRVTAAQGGAPMEGVEVDIYDADGYWVSYGYTDATGNYHADGLGTGNYFAATYADFDYVNELYNNIPCPYWCDPTTGTPIPAHVDQTTQHIDFALDIAGSIAGVVTDATNGHPISDAWIDIFDSDGYWVSDGFTDSAGAYSAGGLGTGRYHALAYGYYGYYSYYQPQLYDHIPCPDYCDPTTGTPIAVVNSQVTTGIDFELKTGGIISGRITDAASGAPLESAYVEIYDSSGGQVSYGFTDDAGNYSTPGLTTGTYHAVAYDWLGSYQSELYDNIPCGADCNPASGTPIHVIEDQTTGGINFALSTSAPDQTGMIAGTITDSATSLPIDQVEVKIYNSSGYVTNGFTNSAGSFAIHGISPGSYYVLAMGTPSYVGQLYNHIICPDGICAFSGASPVLVSAGHTANAVQFALESIITVNCLYCDEFEDGVLDADWTYKQSGWSEVSGHLIGVSKKKMSAIADPAFGGCSSCTQEVSLQTSGGKSGRVVILGWYAGKDNGFQLELSEHKDTWTLKENVSGSVVRKIKADKIILPNTYYTVRMVHDGTSLQVFVDDMVTPLITTATAAHTGTTGFEVKKTTVVVDYVRIH